MPDDFGRPDWDSFYMSMCFVVARRSIDPHTKHGCVVVAEDNTPLVFGYNGPPRKCNDELIPLTRPEKYDYIVHSEEAAIANAARHGISLRNSTFYITGHPCSKCVRLMINAGAQNIIYGPVSSNCVNDKEKEIIKTILTNGKLQLKQYIDNECEIIVQDALNSIRMCRCP